MTKVKVVTENDIGNGLAIEESKLVAKGYVDATINEDNELVLTDAAGEETKLALPKQQVDVKLASAKMLDDGETLELTLSDGSVVTVSLATLMNTDTVPTAIAIEETTFKLTLSDGNELTADIKQALDTIKGEELQSLGGVSLGYLMK